VLTVIIVLQPFMQFVIYYDSISLRGFCFMTRVALTKVFLAFSGVVIYIIPFAVILTFNVATVATLIRQRLRRQSVTGHRDHVNVFTKLTFFTGLSFCLAYTLIIVYRLPEIIEVGMSALWIRLLFPPAEAMMYFNSVINPIICYVVCKSVRDDINHFLRDIARRIRRCCTRGCSQREIPSPNVDRGTPAIENIELTSRHTGTYKIQTSFRVTFRWHVCEINGHHGSVFMQNMCIHKTLKKTTVKSTFIKLQHVHAYRKVN